MMFVAVGLLGALLLIASLLFDDFVDGLIPDNEWISGTAVGAFLAAFGIVGWTAESGFDAPRTVAALAGVGGGLALGWFAFRLGRALMRSPTDPPPSPARLVGHGGRVVTAIRAGGLGEVMVQLGGQPTKFTATATADLATGRPIVVVAVVSATKLVVEAADTFWEPTAAPPEER